MNKIKVVDSKERIKGGFVSYKDVIPDKFYSKAKSIDKLERSGHSIYQATDLVCEDRGRAFIFYRINGGSDDGPWLRWSDYCFFIEVEVEAIHCVLEVSKVYV